MYYFRSVDAFGGFLGLYGLTWSSLACRPDVDKTGPGPGPGPGLGTVRLKTPSMHAVLQQHSQGTTSRRLHANVGYVSRLLKRQTDVTGTSSEFTTVSHLQHNLIVSHLEFTPGV